MLEQPPEKPRAPHHAGHRERLRERARISAGFVAREGGQIIGSVRLWAITVGGEPALFLGPIAVSAASGALPCGLSW